MSYNATHTRWHTQHERGFTLVEMLVAVALFAVVMLVGLSSLLALTEASRKAQALYSVMSNLNITIDGMVRSIRMGTNYHCGSGAIESPRDCTSGGTLLAFEAFGGDTGTIGDQWVYRYDATTKRLYKSETGAVVGGIPLTAPEVQIDSLEFIVTGSTPGDTTQPKVIVVVKGTAGADNVKTRTTFTIQAVATQRLLDI